MSSTSTSTAWTWQDIMDFFTEKRDSLEKSDVARFKARAYNVMISRIRQSFSASKRASCREVLNMNITDHMKDEICTLIKTRRISPRGIEKSLKSRLIALPGLGPASVEELIKSGLRSVNELETTKWFNRLPEETKVHLRHTPENKIPHEVIFALAPIISGFDVENTFIAGSYRRNLPYSRDIDVILVSEDPFVLDQYLAYLEQFLNVYTYSKGRDKMSVVIETGTKKQSKKTISTIIRDRHVYKMDVFRTEPDEKWSMLLYLTGSKSFNIKMRSRAMRLGYLLNQNGLFDQGRRVPIDSEEGYFKILGMQYVNPEERF
jgi:DNA polymerase/3'-5' exonuclease PolX